MKWQIIVISIVFFTSNLTLAEADLNRGKASYVMCASCHGADGAGNTAMNAPALNGQAAEYIARQLNNYKSGVRGSEAGDMYSAQMKGMAAILADIDINNVSAYIASLPATVVTSSEEGDLHKGNNAYQGKCGACHGGKAQGNELMNAPALANLDSAYIARQVANYKGGLRGGHPDDRFGKQMKMMANVIANDEELTNIIAYIHSIPAS
jgi:cbb3-type cytochrome c oxidase subunit III